MSAASTSTARPIGRRAGSHWLTSLRSKVTLTVLAVSTCLFALLGSVGFVQIAGSGRAAIRERIDQVLVQLEASVRSGSGTVDVSTPDGVQATVVADGSPVRATASDQLVVRRSIEVGGRRVQLVGRASQARLTDSLHSLWLGLWIGIPIASIASALMAGFATRRALRPVAAITDLAATIGARQDDRRVAVPDSGDEIERLARTMNDMLDRIATGRAAQQRFTSDAAHELRTPLMALQGELELATRSTAAPDRDALARLDHHARRLGTRVDDLVLLSTLDEGRPLRPTRGSLLDVVREEAELLGPSGAPGESPAVTTAVVGDPGVGRFDAELVARAARNLLANAVRHAHAQVVATVTAVAVDGRHEWRLDVDDDGPGIPPADRDAVFHRFGRLDAARHRDAGGSGLGLAIVESVARRHGGRVAAEAGPLGGARLTMWLPVEPVDIVDRAEA
jgi:signal transduction histidine kinase